MQITQTLLSLAAFAGAVHVLAPDHWLPASVLVWQRGWNWNRALLFAVLLLAAHVLLGFLVFKGGFEFLVHFTAWDPAAVTPRGLFAFSVVLVLSATLIRGLRFGRLGDLSRTVSPGWGGVLQVAALLGPCEAIIPVFMKAKMVGMGYLLPLAAFLAGTLVTGTFMVLAGRRVWNRPLWLPWSVDLAHRRRLKIPVAAGVSLGLAVIMWLPR